MYTTRDWQKFARFVQPNTRVRNPLTGEESLLLSNTPDQDIGSMMVTNEGILTEDEKQLIDNPLLLPIQLINGGAVQMGLAFMLEFWVNDAWMSMADILALPE